MVSKKNRESGTLTVEAAFVMPICIFAIMVFLFLFQIMSLQVKIQYALTQTAKECSQYSYIVKEYKKENIEKGQSIFRNRISNGIISHVFLKERVKSYVPLEKEYHSILSGGVSFLESSILQDGETIDIIAKYQVRIPVPLISVKKFSVIQRVKTRAFIGVLELEGTDNTDDTDGSNQYVYVTDTGTAYHLNRNCTHILLSIKSCNLAYIDSMRNNSGGKYKPCERCCKEGNEHQVVYITNEGTRYHDRLDCSGLKRTVKRIPLSEVRNRTLCKKCGGSREGESFHGAGE